MEELADFAEAVGSLQLHYMAIFLGAVLAWKIADRKGNEMPRDSRQRVGRASLILIIFGVALGGFTVLTPLLAKTGGGAP